MQSIGYDMPMVKRCFCILLLCSVLPCTAVFAADKVPQPEGWVNDYAGVISSEYRGKLNRLIEALEEKTSTEIAVVSVGSIAPYDEKEYARLLFDSWKPGKVGKDNGVLILLAVKERRWRIETGYGVEGILPDGLCGEIGRNYMVPYFRDGRYGEGLYYGAAAIAKTISRHAGVSIDGIEKADFKKGTASAPPSPAYVVLLIIVILLIVLLRVNQAYGGGYYYGSGRSGGGFGGGGFGGGGFGGGGGGGGGAGGGF